MGVGEPLKRSRPHLPVRQASPQEVSRVNVWCGKVFVHLSAEGTTGGEARDDKNPFG